MNPKQIPRRHRKHVIAMVEEYKRNIGKQDHLFKNWNEFLRYRLIGTNDGWISTNNKEYQALVWLIGIRDMMSYFEALEEPT